MLQLVAMPSHID